MSRLLVTAATIASLACGGSTATPPEDVLRRAGALDDVIVPTSPPGIRGILTQIVLGDSVLSASGVREPSRPVSCPPACDASGRPIRSVLVEETPGAAAGGDKSMVQLPASARVLRRTATGVVPAGFADLRVDQRVSVWFDGPVAESYPTQSRGLVLVIEP